MNNIPKGYKLVPVEPTEEMLDAFCGAKFYLLPVSKQQQQENQAYAQMLAAAPTAPQTIYDEAKERELFESQLGHLMRNREEDGTYSYHSIQHQWYGWLACAQSRAKAGEVGHE